MKIPSGNSYKLSPLTPANKNIRSGVWEQLWDPCPWAEHAACFGFISSSVDSCPERPEQHEGWSAPVCAPPQGHGFGVTGIALGLWRSLFQNRIRNKQGRSGIVVPDTRRRVLGPWCQGPCLGDPAVPFQLPVHSVRFAEPFPCGQQGCVSDVPSGEADTRLWSLCLFLKVFTLESCSLSLCADRNLSHSSGAGQTGVRAPLSPFQRWSGRARRGGRCCPGSQGPAQLQGCWGPSSAP